MNEERITARLIRGCAERELGGSEMVANALGFFNEHPQLFSKRVEQFEDVIRTLNMTMSEARSQPSRFRDLVNLNNLVNGDILPTLRTLTTPQSRQISRSLQDTFVEIKGFSGRWEWVRQEENPGRLATGLLIEGYGLLLGKTYAPDSTIEEQEKLARVFVLAFEGAMYLQHKHEDPRPQILQDILPWMIEERDGFPEGIRNLLEQEKSNNIVGLISQSG